MNGMDRLSIRERPKELPVMYQSWLKLLFIHWRANPELLRPHLPEGLEIDLFDGSAWIGITPFALKNLRPTFAPPVPWLSNFHEINLRTYVHYQGVPGIWFFSLDADRALAVFGARSVYHLPYRHAAMVMRADKESIFYSSRRLSHPLAEFKATWMPGPVLGVAALDTLEFFLVERYCLYSFYEEKLYRARIWHQPWNLQRAQLTDMQTTMLEAHGLQTAGGKPLLHYSGAQHVAVWALKPV
ncbi:DUF2071 domain-containing protein [Geotalea sp. SG265]|uniref:YqjF family protein n=1 Tax=Geotalea sp. SG265 TaxID=2922867 RepID=UPI001FAF6FB5|nr:DUF2071 domain-containing protein [Geotalea sp. SG265]